MHRTQFNNWVTMVTFAEEAVDPVADVMEGFGQDVQQLSVYVMWTM